jgi:hypothetical protein
LQGVSTVGSGLPPWRLLIFGQEDVDRAVGFLLHRPAEAIGKAADTYNRTRLTPAIQSLLRRWLAW